MCFQSNYWKKYIKRGRLQENVHCPVSLSISFSGTEKLFKMADVSKNPAIQFYPTLIVDISEKFRHANRFNMICDNIASMPL